MNIKKGKEIFFKYHGSQFYIDRELGDEYKKCRIPKFMEEQWLKEIKGQLLIDIYNYRGVNRLNSINSYLQIANEQEAIECLINILENFELDTFLRMIITEDLKRYLYKLKDINEDLIQKMTKEISLSKDMMLNNKIEVDETFKELQCMQDFDFSVESIINRIKKI